MFTEFETSPRKRAHLHKPGSALAIAGTTALALLAMAAAPVSAQEGDTLPSREEMWRMIQAQNKQIEALQKTVHANSEKVEATGDAVETIQTTAGDTGYGSGIADRTSIGGYGELHYEGGDKDEIDFHRFVVFINHEFSDRIRLYSEVELEHAEAGDGKAGEVELEQAWLEFDLTAQHRARAGLFLIPVGILNETHEPPSFFGVERNSVEKNILPTTWWEGGIGLAGEVGNGFSYDVAAHSGLNVPTTGNNAFKIRDGRQKVSEAKAKDGAVTGRLKWTGMPGVELAMTAQYQQDLTQSTQDVEATLIETHADIRRGGWGLRALYARWDLSGAGPEAVGRDEQSGWYVEPSYRHDTDVGEFGVFARYSAFDNEAGNSTDTEVVEYAFGINYWPHEQVVFKFDYLIEDRAIDADEDDRVNLGVGFQF